MFNFKWNKEQLNTEKLEKSLEQIISLVVQKSGVPRCVRFDDDSTVAFSGSFNEPDLVLVLGIDKDENLSASLDDEVSWFEWDFENVDEFVEKIANHIAPLVNHTVKYVKEYKKYEHIRFMTFVLDEKKHEWITISDEKINATLLNPFVVKDEREEIIKVYNI